MSRNSWKPREGWERRLWPLCILIIVPLFWALLLWTTTWTWEYWSEQTFRGGHLIETKTDRARIIQQIAVIVLGVPALFFAIWRTWTAHRQAQASLDQARIAAANTKLAERGQSIERYAKAASMLDSERLAVRQAGIYALRDLALSNPEQSFQLSLQLLSGFARAQAIEIKKENGDLFKKLNDPDTALRHITLPETPPDLAEAISVIGDVRACVANPAELETRKQYLSLKDVLLSFRSISHANFDGMDISGMLVFGATFANVSFRSGMLFNIRVFKSNFRDCDFSQALFVIGSMVQTSFIYCDFTRTVFSPEKIDDIHFFDCNVSRAHFRDCSLQQGALKRTFCWAGHLPMLPDEYEWDGLTLDGAEHSDLLAGFDNVRAWQGNFPRLPANLKRARLP